MSNAADHTVLVKLPARCLRRIEKAVENIRKEDALPMRERDPRVYSEAYGTIETFALMLGVTSDDPADAVAAVRQAVEGEGVSVPRY